MASATSPELTIVGRSTSHFTRVTRIFAAEARLEFAFQVVPDLRLSAQADYAGNPALKVPILRAPGGEWFGSLNICRELWRRAAHKPRVVWPEDLEQAVLANAQELVLQAMSTEVTLLMSRFFGESDGAHAAKLLQSLTNSVQWLERHIDGVLVRLPANRDLSYLELTLYCLVRHLPFREALSTEPYTKLNAFLPCIRDTALGQRHAVSRGLIALSGPRRAQALSWNTDPRGLLGESASSLVLDEVQRAPDLLSYLQGIREELRRRRQVDGMVEDVVRDVGEDCAIAGL